MKGVGHLVGMGEVTCIWWFDGETWGKEQLGRVRRRWDDDINMDIQK
jgi:hypothetical protein